MKAAGKPTDRRNLVTGVNVQVCWERFCRYWDVEPRLAPEVKNYTVFDVSARLREEGWLVPATRWLATG